jgi:hypothetical protein
MVTGKGLVENLEGFVHFRRLFPGKLFNPHPQISFGIKGFFEGRRKGIHVPFAPYYHSGVILFACITKHKRKLFFYMGGKFPGIIDQAYDPGTQVQIFDKDRLPCPGAFGQGSKICGELLLGGIVNAH